MHVETTTDLCMVIKAGHEESFTRLTTNDNHTFTVSFQAQNSLLAPNWTVFSDYTGPDLLCSMVFYAALLPRRGLHIASHSVCLSVCPSVCLSVRPVIVTERHVVPPSELQ